MNSHQFSNANRSPFYPQYGSDHPPPNAALPRIHDIFQRETQSQTRVANLQHRLPPIDFAPPQLPSFAHSGHPPHPAGPSSSQATHIYTTPTYSASTTALPDDDDDDEFPPTHKLLSTIARPAVKVAGQRRPKPDPKGKGKQIQDAPRPNQASTSKATKRKAVAAADPPEPKKQKGRSNGAANYSEDDIYGLLDIIRRWLPIGGKAWNSVGDEFNEWAEENSRPSRTVKSLEAKFKQLVKTTKPTGDAEMPDYINDAHEIEDEMNNKAGTRDLDDDDLVDVIEVSDDEVENMKPTPKKTVVKKEPGKFVARRPTTDHLPSRSSRTPRLADDLLSNLSRTLDPVTQAANSEERATRAFQANQLFSMAAQLREQQSVVESLRTRLAESDRERNSAERRADKAEMLCMLSNAKTQRESRRHHWASSPASNRTPTRPVRQDVFYRDGGHATRWIGPDDDEPLHPDSPGTRAFCRYTPEPASSCQSSSHSRLGRHGTPREPGPSTSASSLALTLTPSRRADHSDGLSLLISAGNTNTINNPSSSPRTPT